MGVSGPLTGPNAQYGAQWKQGFDLALDEIHAAGGINGRKLVYIFEDSQSDPRQSVAIAQKFVSDSKIVMELGDFSSTASMAASPIYQRAGLVQFGFTNSHPDFTKGGDFMWSTSVSQADEQPLLARYAVTHLGLKKLAILHLNTDWGRTSRDHFATAAKEYGAEVVISEGYIADERDFRSTLVRVPRRQSGWPDPDLVLFRRRTDCPPGATGRASSRRSARRVRSIRRNSSSLAATRSRMSISAPGIFPRIRAPRCRNSSRASRPSITGRSPTPSTSMPMMR